MMRLSRLVPAFAVLAAICSTGVAFGQSRPTVWDGVYTSAQASRGEISYASACASCHAQDLRGDSNTPSIVGVSFQFLWGDMSLGALFAKIQNQMPTDRPNSLPAQVYTDILAYVLEANQFPPGEDELTSDPAVLDPIVITVEAP